ncbi:MAG: hypothetical protein I4O51_12910 [Flavobacterium micromati]|nr:hypothetical protein [Flavobacterium micromati]
MPFYAYIVAKKHENLKATIAIGDGPNWIAGNPDVSQFSVYGSGHVGIAGAIIAKTDVPEILKLDCLATDFYRGQAYPTFLLYNPNEEEKTVTYQTKNTEKIDLYDAITQEVIIKNVYKLSKMIIPKESSRLIVELPAGSKIVFKNGKYYVNETVISYL